MFAVQQAMVEQLAGRFACYAMPCTDLKGTVCSAAVCRPAAQTAASFDWPVCDRSLRDAGRDAQEERYLTFPAQILQQSVGAVT